MGLFAPTPPAGYLERLARLSVVLADRAMARYTSRFSRHDYTQPQLVAILLVKGALDQTYRDVYHFLKSSDSMREALGIRRVPHWTTLERTSNTSGMQALLVQLNEELFRMMGKGEPPRVDAAAIDSTGFETTVKSAYFAKRSQTKHDFVKASLAIARDLMLPCALITSMGASNDLTQAKAVVRAMCKVIQPRRMYADAGFDSEDLHRQCREVHGIESIIKPVPQAPDGSIKTKYRSMMVPLPDHYGKRAAVESVISAIKRSCGSRLRARSPATLQVELACKVLGYALKVLRLRLTQG